MKTLVLATASAVALLAAGVASAQTSSGVEATFSNAQAGLSSLNGADSSRPGQPYDSRSYISQVGDGNSANVDQTIGYTQGGPSPSAPDNNYGHPLSSVVLQGWGGGKSTGSSANTTQSGLSNVSVTMQRDYNGGGNYNSTTQSGTNDNAFSYQYGTKNSATIAQSGTDSSAPSSSVTDASTANSGGTYAGSFHGADQATSHLNDGGGRIIQDEAQGNGAYLTQTGTNVTGTIEQWYGEGNFASVTQGGTSNHALSYQTGYGSTVGINQSAASSNNKATVYQVSADQDGSAYGVVGANDSGVNSAFVTQTGQNSSATELQAGTNNLASITQSTGSIPGDVRDANFGSDAAIRQVGMNNNAGTNQSGADDHALTQQSGSYNTAFTTQTNAGAYSLVDQSGSGNYTSVTQTTGGLTNSFFTVSKVDQEGANNGATVYQSGRDAFSDVAQNGMGNAAFVTQTAFNPVAYTYQAGNGNYASTTQH